MLNSFILISTTNVAFGFPMEVTVYQQEHNCVLNVTDKETFNDNNISFYKADF